MHLKAKANIWKHPEASTYSNKQETMSGKQKKTSGRIKTHKRIVKNSQEGSGSIRNNVKELDPPANTMKYQIPSGEVRLRIPIHVIIWRCPCVCLSVCTSAFFKHFPLSDSIAKHTHGFVMTWQMF